MTDKFVLRLNTDELNIVLGALQSAPMPYNVINPMLGKLQIQIQEQLPQPEREHDDGIDAPSATSDEDTQD